MRHSIALILTVALAGCAYVTREQFRELWDQDGDGWGFDEDCNDNNGYRFPYAPDLRGDGCDADCGKEPDADLDDWPDDADCAPDDPDIFPCNPAEKIGDTIDSDCDGEDGVNPDGCNPGIAGWLSRWGPDPDWDIAVYKEILPDECDWEGEPIRNTLFDPAGGGGG